jgi:hypothetical protein
MTQKCKTTTFGMYLTICYHFGAKRHLTTTFGAGLRRRALIFQFSSVNQLSDLLGPPVSPVWQILGQIVLFDYYSVTAPPMYLPLSFFGLLTGGPHLSGLSSLSSSTGIGQVSALVMLYQAAATSVPSSSSTRRRPDLEGP